jgi:hypothetical protein
VGFHSGEIWWTRSEAADAPPDKNEDTIGAFFVKCASAGELVRRNWGQASGWGKWLGVSPQAVQVASRRLEFFLFCGAAVRNLTSAPA